MWTKFKIIKFCWFLSFKNVFVKNKMRIPWIVELFSFFLSLLAGLTDSFFLTLALSVFLFMISTFLIFATYFDVLLTFSNDVIDVFSVFDTFYCRFLTLFDFKVSDVFRRFRRFFIFKCFYVLFSAFYNLFRSFSTFFDVYWTINKNIFSHTVVTFVCKALQLKILITLFKCNRHQTNILNSKFSIFFVQIWGW